MAVISQSQVGSGVTYDISNDALRILSGVRYQNTDEGDPTITSTNGGLLFNNGHIGGVDTTGSSLTILNGAGAVIEGNIRSGQDQGFALKNHGTIIGEITVRPNDTQSTVQIANHGLIDGIIYISGTDSDVRLYGGPVFFVFWNSGVISSNIYYNSSRATRQTAGEGWSYMFENHGDIYGDIIPHTADDQLALPYGYNMRFINSGAITGRVSLYEGSDYYLGMGDGFVTDYVFAAGGNDTMLGGSLDDLFLAGAGRDFLKGRQGDDGLSGGGGADHIYGGTGDDTFIYESFRESARGFGVDIIHDFRHGQDKIDFSGMVNGRLKYLGGDDFNGNGKAELRMILGQKGRATLLADTNGDGKADFTLTLLGQRGLLSQDDFIL